MKYLVLSTSIALAGCSSGHYEWDSKAMEYSNLNFIGIPTAIGIGASGSSVPVTESLSLTNRHVAGPLLKTVVNKSGACDVALIKQNNKGETLHKFSLMKLGERVHFYGYSGLTTMPVSSTGVVTSFNPYKGCTVAYTTAGGVAGMSGGAVVNDNGEIVGIILGLAMGEGKTVVIPYQSFKEIMPISVQDDVKARWSTW